MKFVFTMYLSNIWLYMYLYISLFRNEVQTKYKEKKLQHKTLHN